MVSTIFRKEFTLPEDNQHYHHALQHTVEFFGDGIWGQGYGIFSHAHGTLQRVWVSLWMWLTLFWYSQHFSYIHGKWSTVHFLQPHCWFLGWGEYCANIRWTIQHLFLISFTGNLTFFSSHHLIHMSATHTDTHTCTHTQSLVIHHRKRWEHLVPKCSVLKELITHNW